MFSISFETLTKGPKIGEGGFGIVYKGTYQFGPAAIKQLHIDNLSPEAEEEFNKEAGIMAQLHHPNVVHFYGYCSIPKCLVMEYMPKGSLFSVLHDKKQSLDWNIRMRIATDMVSGLAFLHSKNILHRDIKSLNVLLDEQGKAKLTDFGLSKVKNETKSQTTATKTTKDAVGTVQWMAPELFRRKAVYTQKSDIYSLGITFWELAARKIPYAEDAQAAIPAFIEKGDREDIPLDCPEKLAYLIQQCWAGNPDVRPSASDIARYMTTDAKTFAEGSPTSSVLESAGYQLTSQIPPSFMPAYENNLSPSLSALSLQSNPVSPVAAPNATTQRRESNIINLTDKKEEKEKIRHVLEELRTFFIEDREEGEKTENYAIYNEYLKKANSGAQLVYKSKQNKHILYVNGKAFEDTDAAVQEISKIIEALPLGSGTLTQYNQASKPYPNVSTSDLKELKEFLRMVAEGEQDKAEAMLKSNPTLALVPGDVTDLSKRTFNNITAFQYAVWALDWHMWTMIRKYLPDEDARLQEQGFETGSWVKSYGVHANLNTLIQAYQTTIDLCTQSKWTYGNKAWVEQVGGAQFLLPAHVVNEYCHPTRSFDPCPNFRDASALPRTRRLGASDWFTPVYGTLAINPVCRAKHHGLVKADGLFEKSVAGVAGGFGRFLTSGLRTNIIISIQEVSCDCDSVRALTSTRTAQREELIAELRPKAAQRRAA